MTTAAAKQQTPEQRELAEVASSHPEGLVPPQDVVAYARRHPRGALYQRFTWDDSKAADEHRLWQAREIIAQFWVVSRKERKPVRMFLSLVSDRGQEGGYRHADDVLDDPDRRAEWRRMAIDELEQWASRFAALTELRTVHAAIRRVVKQYED